MSARTLPLAFVLSVDVPLGVVGMRRSSRTDCVPGRYFVAGARATDAHYLLLEHDNATPYCWVSSAEVQSRICLTPWAFCPHNAAFPRLPPRLLAPDLEALQCPFLLPPVAHGLRVITASAVRRGFGVVGEDSVICIVGDPAPELLSLTLASLDRASPKLIPLLVAGESLDIDRNIATGYADPIFFDRAGVFPNAGFPSRGVTHMLIGVDDDFVDCTSVVENSFAGVHDTVLFAMLPRQGTAQRAPGGKPGSAIDAMVALVNHAGGGLVNQSVGGWTPVFRVGPGIRSRVPPAIRDPAHPADALEETAGDVEDNFFRQVVMVAVTKPSLDLRFWVSACPYPIRPIGHKMGLAEAGCVFGRVVATVGTHLVVYVQEVVQNVPYMQDGEGTTVPVPGASRPHGTANAIYEDMRHYIRDVSAALVFVVVPQALVEAIGNPVVMHDEPVPNMTVVEVMMSRHTDLQRLLPAGLIPLPSHHQGRHMEMRALVPDLTVVNHHPPVIHNHPPAIIQNVVIDARTTQPPSHFAATLGSIFDGTAAVSWHDQLHGVWQAASRVSGPIASANVSEAVAVSKAAKLGHQQNQRYHRGTGVWDGSVAAIVNFAEAVWFGYTVLTFALVLGLRGHVARIANHRPVDRLQLEIAFINATAIHHRQAGYDVFGQVEVAPDYITIPARLVMFSRRYDRVRLHGFWRGVLFKIFEGLAKAGE